MPLNVTFDPPVLTLTPSGGARPRSTGDRPASDPIDAEALLVEALAPGFTVAVESARAESLTHLDTVDGRLQKAGIDLAHLPRRRRMVALTAGRQIEQPVTGSWPRLASDLPAGEVTDLVAPAAWIRALIPYASTQAETTTYAIRNGDGKTVVRVHWTTGELTKPSTAALPARVGIEVLRGYGPEAARVRKALTKNTPLVESDQSWFATVRSLPAPRQRRGGLPVSSPAGLVPDPRCC